LLRWRVNGEWRQRVIASVQRAADIPAANVDGVVLNALDKVGNASADVVWRRP
jgi:hypothetical protein